ncbi:hypothetical protein BMETH_321_7 [methanotrophic bacterial endosymbiont of Bathymodiolus sp.]|nr:hypothetical protein BMETH_321_7 [methanotrophic bacterial endosymbiont of Bathymodiolus sp.]
MVWIIRASDIRLPHARGGVSIIIYVKAKCRRSSPRPWGCFR